MDTIEHAAVAKAFGHACIGVIKREQVRILAENLAYALEINNVGWFTMLALSEFGYRT